MKEKEFCLKIKVPIIKDIMPILNGKRGKILMERYNVKGMMKIIKRQITHGDMPPKNTELLMDEYAKFYIFNKLGIEIYPLEK